MKDKIKELEKQVDMLRKRNRRVEADKAWETSKFRVLILTVVTYLLAVLVMDGIKVPEPFLGALIPTLGYFLSVQTLPIAKKWWIRRYTKKLHSPMIKELPETIEVATFGGGRFWGIEEKFRKIKGVVDTEVGYMGGSSSAPTYEDVCSDKTGHVEVAQIYFDHTKVSYEDLVEIFWRIHDPTQGNGQGSDIGSQYRSVIFYNSPEQFEEAEYSKAELESSGYLGSPLATSIEEAQEFFRAEEYHQRYYEKNGSPPD